MLLVQSKLGNVYVEDKESYHVLAHDGIVTVDGRLVGEGIVKMCHVSEVPNEAKPI